MRTTTPARIAGPAVLIAAIAGALACGDLAPPSAPRLAAPDAGAQSKIQLGNHVRFPVLARTQRLRRNEVACRDMDPAATVDVTIALAKAGLKVTFPAGSVGESTEICLTAHAGRLLTYTFEPHGLHFQRPIQVEQDLSHTNAFHNPAVASTLVFGYLEDGVDVDVDADGVGEFAETFDTGVRGDAQNIAPELPSTATFETIHFSGYALASGKADTTTQKK